MADTDIDWKSVISRAAEIIESYETGVTLRQLFYRLVSAELIRNDQNAYKKLSRVSAKARRENRFPDLIDNTRYIRRSSQWPTAEDAAKRLIEQFRRDRTDGQEYSIYVAVEKSALATLIGSWYNERGIPVLAFGGYPSQTFVDDIVYDIDRQERPAVLIYAGDFDPTGVDILRDFEKRTEGKWEAVHRVALNPDQITKYKLPPLPGKHWDARAKGFVETYGVLMQVELDALDPNDLKKIYEDAVKPYWNDDTFQEVLAEEALEKKKLILPSVVEGMIDEIKFIDDINHPQDIIVSDLSAEIIDKYGEVFDV